jgi:hypothetical protein
MFSALRERRRTALGRVALYGILLGSLIGLLV